MMQQLTYIIKTVTQCKALGITSHLVFHDVRNSRRICRTSLTHFIWTNHTLFEIVIHCFLGKITSVLYIKKSYPLPQKTVTESEKKLKRLKIFFFNGVKSRYINLSIIV